MGKGEALGGSGAGYCVGWGWGYSAVGVGLTVALVAVWGGVGVNNGALQYSAVGLGLAVLQYGGNSAITGSSCIEHI